MNIQFDNITSGDVEYELDDAATRGDVSVSRNRMWSLRFRSRWDIVLGKVPSRDRMDTDVVTEKVAITPAGGGPCFQDLLHRLDFPWPCFGSMFSIRRAHHGPTQTTVNLWTHS